MITLRPDQETSVSALRRALSSGRKRVLLQAPTGWGKGTVAAHCLATAANRGKPVAFVCHREEINLDLVDRLHQAGAPTVRILGGQHEQGPEDAAVTVVSIQTLDARDTTLPVSLIWWDECHRAAAASYQRVAERHPAAIHVGTSATPARGDGAPLDFFEELIPGPQVSALVAAGLLAPITTLAPEQSVSELAAYPIEAYPPNRPGVIFAANREHSKATAAGLVARGIQAVHVDGSTPNRKQIVAEFNQGRIDVLCNYRILVEGVDLPRAEVCCFASRISSTVAFLQGIGRVRRFQPKKRALLLDLCGSVHIHGLPDEDRSYHLDGTAIRLAPAHLTAPVQCRTCLSWGLPSSVCEDCGARRPPPKPPRVKARDLIEIKAKQGDDEKRAALLRFIARAVAAGRNPWSAAHVFKGVYGSPPPKSWMLDALRGAA